MPSCKHRTASLTNLDTSLYWMSVSSRLHKQGENIEIGLEAIQLLITNSLLNKMLYERIKIFLLLRKCKNLMGFFLFHVINFTNRGRVEEEGGNAAKSLIKM